MRDLDVSGQRAGLDREIEPAKVPGRTTRVEAEAGRGPAAAAGPGKRTLVDNAGGHMLESAIADAQKYVGELKAALAGQDRTKTKEATTALESALGIIRDSVGSAGPSQGAESMHATLEIFVAAEPLLAKAHATGATGSAGAAPQEVAARGTQGAGQPLPHLEQIQRSFGRHDVSHVQAHTGPAASAAAGELGARAYANGSSVAFAGTPDLHTAAHEAAHVVQQKGGVALEALDGGSGDAHERHADAVADAVVSGTSAESLLDRAPGGGGATVQRKEANAAPPADGKQPQDRGGRPPKGAAKPPKGAGGGAHGGASPKGAAGGAGGAAGGSASAAGFSGGGGIDGKAIKSQLSQFSQAVTANANTVAPPEGVHADPKKDAEEDHAKKVSQYDDGIDGIAGMIGDLDAFDDLCSACSWGGDPGKQGEALGRIRQSKPFHQLSQMWQGALDGGPDSPAMQAAFEHEFSSRGFFGSTQQAYQLVRDAAKAQAKEDAAAAEAKKKAQQAKAKGDAKGIDGKDAGKTAAGKPNAQGVNGGAAGGANAGNLNAVVQQQAAPIGAYEQLKGVSDAEFKSVIASADHHAGLKESMPSLGAEAPRTGQILDQMKRAGSGFEESFIDTVKWGVIAHVGNKLAAGAVEKLIGEDVPVIGPLIALAVDPPWKGKYWSDTGKGFSDGWKSLKSAFNFDAFKSCHSVGDVVGVLCAKVADLFDVFYQWLSTINKLLGTLAAICTILGAVLIGVGIALCWLGIGEGLMIAGGWLVDAGEVLGDISMALVPVCLALAGLGLVFRTAAAFLVPADVYAEQLEQEGGAAESFGKMAGQKVGLDTSRTIEEATPSKPEGKAANPEAATEGGNADEAAGAGDGAELANEAKTGNDALQQDAQAAQAKAQEQAADQKAPEATPEAKPEAKADEKTEHSDENKQGNEETGEKKTEHSDEQDKAKDKGEDEKEGGEDEGEDKKNEDENKKSAGERLKEAAKSLGRRLAESVKTSLSLGRNLGRLGSALAEVPKLFGENAHGAVDRGLSTRHEQIEKNVEQAKESLEKVGEEAESQQDKIQELAEKLNKEDGKLSEEEAAELDDQIDEAIEAWKEAREAAENLEVSLKTLEHWAERARAGAAQKEQPSEQEGEEGDAAEDESGKKKSKEEKRREAEDEAKEKGKELEAAKSKQVDLAKEIVETNNRLEAAKAQKAEADAASETAIKKLEADPANAEKKAASEEVAAKKAAKQRADELDAKAGKIDSAEARRKSAEGKLKQTIGKTVELGGEPAEIVGFNAEGITVKPKARGPERTAKPEEITGGDLPADFKAQAERLAKANQDLGELTDGEQGGNAGAIAKKLHADAANIRKAEAPKKGAKNQAKAERRNKLAADYDAQTAKAEEPAKQAHEAVEAAEKKLEKLKDEQKENDGEIDDLGKGIDDAKDEAHTVRREALRHRRTEKAMENAGDAGAYVISALVGLQLGDEAGEKTKKFFEWLFTRPEAGLGAGGGWLMKVTTLDDRLHQLRGVVASKVAPKFDGKSAEQHENLLAYQGISREDSGEKKEGGEKNGDPGDKAGDTMDAPGASASTDEPAAKKNDAAPSAGVSVAGGEKKGPAEEPSEAAKLKKEAWKVGHAQALYEQLFALRPPPDIALLGEHRKKAAAASVRYYDAHGRAYKAYQAELAVGKLAQDTAQLSEEGKPLHKQSQQSRAPIEKSKGDEAQRQQTLGGAQTGDVKGSDSRMGGMVMGLISKIGDNSDHLSAKPDAGGASGDQMSGGQDKADAESKQRTAQGKSHSQGQQQFLDQALATQQRQEQALAGNIQALDAKQQQELADRDSIRNKKAQALTEEQQARAEAETESAAFNDGYARAKAWSLQYEAKRKDVKAGGGDGP